MTSPIVQAKCPGCQKVLRIPADWLQQAMRCKYCGMTIQARSAAAPTSAKVPPAAPATAATLPLTEALTPLAPPAYPPPPATVQDYAPVALPAAAREDNGPLVQVGRHHRIRRSRWPSIIFLLLLLGGLGAGGWYAYQHREQLMNLINPPAGGSADKTDDKKPGAVTKPGGRKLPSKDGNLKSVKGQFPRRLLGISVNNYLYANPVNYGPLTNDAILANGKPRNFHSLVEGLGGAFRVDKTQTIELSGLAPEELARPPVKAVIESTIKEFLETSRAQDRIILVYLGHAVEIGDQAYLVPVEGELDRKETLISLSWVYDQLTKCKARQKILVMDVCRYDPGRGLERPNGGPMGEKLDAALANPPAGVQVWTACTKGQYSYEYEVGFPRGGAYFWEILGSFRNFIGIQQPDQPIPIDRLATVVHKKFEQTRKDLNITQTPRLSGKEAEDGPVPDPDEPMPPALVIKMPPSLEGGAAKAADVQSILNETEVIPPVKVADQVTLKLRAEALPPFAAKVLEAYKADKEMTPLREAVKKSIDVLIKHAKTFEDTFKVPSGNETQFKASIRNIQEGPALAQLELQEVLEELEKAGEERKEEKSKRWQANYDYVLARLKARIAYVHEYNYMLGSMRKELPPRDPKKHDGWRLASQAKLVSGNDSRKLAAESKKILEKIVKDHPGTPWEVLAKRERLNTLGLKWEPVSFGSGAMAGP